MKNILLILALSIGLNSMASDPIKKEIPNRIHKEFRTAEPKVDGILLLAAGAAILGLGIYQESIRQPYPYHSTSIDYNPNVGRNINYMVMGAGIGFGLGGAIKLLIK
jgi:hypothetical protein